MQIRLVVRVSVPFKLVFFPTLRPRANQIALRFQMRIPNSCHQYTSNHYYRWIRLIKANQSISQNRYASPWWSCGGGSKALLSLIWHHVCAKIYLVVRAKFFQKL